MSTSVPKATRGWIAYFELDGQIEIIWEQGGKWDDLRRAIKKHLGLSYWEYEVTGVIAAQKSWPSAWQAWCMDGRATCPGMAHLSKGATG